MLFNFYARDIHEHKGKQELFAADDACNDFMKGIGTGHNRRTSAYPYVHP